MGACFDSGEVKVPERWEGGKSWHGMETETAGNPDDIEASRDMFLARLEEPGRRATLACQCGELREIPTTQPGIGFDPAGTSWNFYPEKQQQQYLSCCCFPPSDDGGR